LLALRRHGCLTFRLPSRSAAFENISIARHAKILLSISIGIDVRMRAYRMHAQRCAFIDTKHILEFSSVLTLSRSSCMVSRSRMSTSHCEPVDNSLSRRLDLRCRRRSSLPARCCCSGSRSCVDPLTQLTRPSRDRLRVVTAKRRNRCDEQRNATTETDAAAAE